MTQSCVQILVVDDERNIRNNLTPMLESAGYKVEASGDGEDALAKCKSQHYDIAFVDIQMPKIGGLELLRHLHTQAKDGGLYPDRLWKHGQSG